MALSESRPGPVAFFDQYQHLLHISYHCSELLWDHNLRTRRHIGYSQYPAWILLHRKTSGFEHHSNERFSHL